MNYSFPASAHFVNRADDLDALERWWEGADRNALNLYGRRRVGKSWLFRKFADGKPATILVAERLAQGSQLSRLSSALEQDLGFTPQISDVPQLVRLLYQLGRESKRLVVLDEFPYLLPRAEVARDEVLTAIQAVMEEERDQSNTKLILCGSHIGSMQALMSEGCALRGRLTPLNVTPMTIAEAGPLLTDTDPEKRIERFAVAGGMARYLAELGSGGTLRARVCAQLLDHRGALFNDPREVLEQELEQVATYFSILQELSSGHKSAGEIAAPIGMKVTSLGRPLDTLRDMKVIDRYTPINARPEHTKSRYGIADPFLRFWFRFVFPFQEDLSSGLAAGSLYDLEIAPNLADHVAPVFEALCRTWVRSNRGEKISRVASWWGPTTKTGRDAGRSSEEIDVVATGAGRVRVIGECKWTTAPPSVSLLAALDDYKIPALRADKLRIARDCEKIIFSRSGFTDGLIAAAAKDSSISLVAAADLLSGI